MRLSIALTCALLCTLAAVFFGVTTFATNDYTMILTFTWSFAAGSVLLLVPAWRQLMVPGRVIAGFLICIDLLLVWDAVFVRLAGS